MNRRITNVGRVTHEPPRVLDPTLVDSAVTHIVYQHNLLADDFERALKRLSDLESRYSYLHEKWSSDHRRTDDLYDLMDFLEKNPGTDIKDWVRYEAIKKRMNEAAGNVG